MTFLLNLISVDLYIKAQILLSDIWVCFKKHEFGFDYDLNVMRSMIFVDSRVSQILRHFKLLKYSTELMNKLENSKLFFKNANL